MNTTKQAKSRGGRPRGFDRDEAIETALQLFWRHGYEGVSVGDLTAAIGIAAPSLYAAFGSKAGLFREALARYAEQSAVDWSAFAAADSLERAVRGMLRASVRAVTLPNRARGCMISSGMIACHEDHAELASELSARRDALRGKLTEHLREFLDAKPAAALARYLCAVMQGISVQARDGATLDELYVITDHALRVLPAPATPKRR